MLAEGFIAWRAQQRTVTPKTEGRKPDDGATRHFAPVAVARPGIAVVMAATARAVPKVAGAAVPCQVDTEVDAAAPAATFEGLNSEASAPQASSAAQATPSSCTTPRARRCSRSSRTQVRFRASPSGTVARTVARMVWKGH
jgi:hypothetical protein